MAPPLAFGMSDSPYHVYNSAQATGGVVMVPVGGSAARSMPALQLTNAASAPLVLEGGHAPDGTASRALKKLRPVKSPMTHRKTRFTPEVKKAKSGAVSMLGTRDAQMPPLTLCRRMQSLRGW